MKLFTPPIAAAVLTLSGALALGAGLRGAAGGARTPAGAPDGPVLLELFTSEGCSSCPPADQYLNELTSAGEIRGVPVVTLSEHVDYWNRYGWNDPFSSASFTDRQLSYSRRLPSEVYTPQLVVDGRWQTIGSDRGRAAALIAQAAAEKKAQVSAVLTPGAGAVTVHATVAPGSLERLPDGDVYVGLVESGLVSTVTAGENAGRRLAHAAVARRLERAGRVKGGAPDAQVDATLTLQPSWAAGRTSVVVFVQARTGAIVGAWSSPLAMTSVR